MVGRRLAGRVKKVACGSLAIAVLAGLAFMLNAPLSEVVRNIGCAARLDTKFGGEYSIGQYSSEDRGCVEYTVYLPPGWREGGNSVYPLLLFLHGQGDRHSLLAESVPATDLNDWINSGKLPPLVIVAPQARHVFAIDRDFRDDQQWTAPSSSSVMADGIIRHSQSMYRAGVMQGQVSIQGFSRGSRAALHFGFTHPDIFASAVANGFVSDYALDEEMDNASFGQRLILENRLRIRISIGNEDQWVINWGRTASRRMHEYLQSLGIDHEYEVLGGVTHNFAEIANYRRSDGEANLLHELKLHAMAWKRRRPCSN